MPTVDEVLDLLDTHLDEADLGSLAERVHLSRFHLHRLLTAALGEPPGALRRRLLLERSAHRLTTTADTVVDVAIAAGYDSPDGFSRAFTRAFGLPPSDYRRTAGCAIASRRRPASTSIRPAASRCRLSSERSHGRPSPHGGPPPRHHRRDPRPARRRPGRARLPNRASPSRGSTSADPAHPQRPARAAARAVGRRLEGGTSVAAGDTSPAGLRRRLDAVAPRFREVIVAPVADGEAESTFVDLTCDPAADLHARRGGRARAHVRGRAPDHGDRGARDRGRRRTWAPGIRWPRSAARVRMRRRCAAASTRPDPRTPPHRSHPSDPGSCHSWRLPDARSHHEWQPLQLRLSQDVATFATLTPGRSRKWQQSRGRRGRRSGGRGVEALLGRRQAVRREREDRIRGVADEQRQLLALGRREVAQHEVGGGCRPGGRPMPTRTRAKSGVPSTVAMSRTPLWPPCPPPVFRRSVPNGMSSSSCTTISRSGVSE